MVHNPKIDSVEVSDEGTITSSESVSVVVTTHLWLRWADIAIQREHEARSARSKANATKAGGGSDFVVAIDNELDASMQAIVSAAFAIDAFYSAVKPHITIPPVTGQAWEKNGTARHARIIETLKAGFQTHGTGSQKWTKLKSLFKLRDGVVHYPESANNQLQHPLGIPLSPLHVAYRLEEAELSLDLMLEIFELCISNPRLQNRALQEYVKNIGNSVQQRVQIRAASRNGSV